MSCEHFPVVFPEILPPKECEENKCLNGGSCTQYRDGYKCSCSAGFTGDTCEIKGIHVYGTGYAKTEHFAQNVNLRYTHSNPNRSSWG